VSIHRRRFLRSLPLAALPAVAGCSRPSKTEPVDLRMARVVNLAERVLSVELTAMPAGADNAEARVLYAGPVGTQAGDAGAGEVVLQPDGIERPLRHDYRLSVAGGASARLSSRALEAGRQHAPGDGGCVELDFAVRSATEDSGASADYEFWTDCEAAPGTVSPSTDS